MSQPASNPSGTWGRLEVLRSFFASGSRRAEDYLALCLHEPGFGYYASRASLGPRGDFATAATLGDGLARAIAAWIIRHAPARGPLHAIELGPGDGSLAARVRALLPWHQRRRLRLHLVETSPALAQRQRQQLGRHLVGQHLDPASALSVCSGKALIWSNELVDAFAPVVLQWDGEVWSELGLDGRIEDGQLHLAERPLACPAARLAEFDSVALDPASWPTGAPPPGQRIEIPVGYRRWLARWCPAWHRGRMLTIDYGDHHPALYFRRLRGTLRGYRHHQRLQGSACWRDPGRQDLTFDINFTDLDHWHEAVGLRGITTDLGPWMARLAPEVGEDDASRVAGHAFRVREDEPMQ